MPQQPLPVADRFWAKVDKNGPIPVHRPDLGPCWIWGGSTIKGYGGFWTKERTVLAHRWSYEDFTGEPITAETLDHLCRNILCVNPAHLEPVTAKENLLRGDGPCAINARKTHCINGHLLSGDNLYVHTAPCGKVSRYCRTCRKIADQKADRSGRIYKKRKYI